jgi:hypothetical protein
MDNRFGQPGLHRLARSQFDWVDPPARWASAALRASLGLAGTILTAVSLWSVAPPPL